jgi:hypothetical protein
MRAACFTILACGHEPRCALDTFDSGASRFEMIVGLIAKSDLSIHDISRTELDKKSGLPRFNMPLELGADLGLRLHGTPRQKRKRILVLDSVPHQYDITTSDISGMDVAAHGNDQNEVIRHVRDWLNADDPEAAPLAGAEAIVTDYGIYRSMVPDMIAALRLGPHDELTHIDYLKLVKRALPEIEKLRTGGFV